MSPPLWCGTKMGHVLASSTPASQETLGMNKWFTACPVLHPSLRKRVGTVFIYINFLFCSFSFIVLLFLRPRFPHRMYSKPELHSRNINKYCLPRALLLQSLFCGYCYSSGAADLAVEVEAFNHVHSLGGPWEQHFPPGWRYLAERKNTWSSRCPATKERIPTNQVKGSGLKCC